MAFIESLNQRDAAFFASLPGVPVEDPGHLAYQDTTSFDSIEEWAESSWSQDEVWAPVGFLGSLDVTVRRESPRLRALGLSSVVSDFRFETDDCNVTSLEVTVPAGEPEPCGFVEARPAIAQVAPNDSLVQGCTDGTTQLARTNHASISVDAGLMILGGYAPGGIQRQDGFVIGSIGEITPVVGAPFDSFILGAVHTGEGILVWGTSPVRVAFLDPVTLEWRTLAEPNADLIGATPAVWTGSHLVLVPTDPGTGEMTLLAYELESDTWNIVEGFPLADRSNPSLVWTGSEVILWGGSNGIDYSDGAAYDPASGTWRVLADSPIQPRVGHSAVWTGAEMLIWGGQSNGVEISSGARYAPESDTWSQIPDAPIEGRLSHSDAWTGSELLVWGGVRREQPVADGAAFNTATSTWRNIAPSPIEARCQASSAWTGASLVVFGGWNCDSANHATFGDGAVYDPATDSWSLLGS
jgi:hypothetical protein